MRSVLRPLFLVSCAAMLAGCLEGDPNPFANGGDGGVASTTTLSVVEPSGYCSKQSLTHIAVKFTNHTPGTTVNLLWVDFTCQERSYGQIAPGQSQEVQTFISHPWRLRDATTNALYKEFIPASINVTEVSLP